MKNNNFFYIFINYMYNIFNKIKYDNLYDIFILFILFIKIIFYLLFIITYLLEKYNKKYNNIDKKIIENLNYFNKRINIIFYILIFILIIYIFNPFHNNLHLIDFNVRFLLFTFGFIYLLSAEWNIFF